MTRPPSPYSRPFPLLAPLLVLAAGCAGTSTDNTVAMPEYEKRQAELKRESDRQRDFRTVLIRIDQAIDSYVTSLNNRGDSRADEQAGKLQKLLQETVLDTGGRSLGGVDPNSYEAGENFRQLKALAIDGSEPDRQAIALAALGFSGRTDVTDLLVQGAMLDDPFRADKAVLGLAVLRSPKTPPGVLAAIIENPQHPEAGRVQAAWALVQVQSAMLDDKEIVTIWRRYLGPQRDQRCPGVLVSAIRGLGMTRDAANADLVAPLLKHPVPRIRMASALALGRMNAQDHWRELLALLEPQETQENVRLHARKALAALAGNQDYGYDVAAWQKVFDRGR